MTRFSRKIMTSLFGAAVIGGAASGLTKPVEPPPLDMKVTVPGEAKPINPFLASTPRAEMRLAAEPATLHLVAATEPATIKHDASVSLEWVGPIATKVNQPATYTLNVRNTCGQPLQKVAVQVRVPKDARVSETDPVAKVVDGISLWEIGTLDAKATKVITLTLAHPVRGDLGCQAWVTATGMAGMTVKVLEPKLLAKIAVPETVALGDPIPVRYTTANIGDSPLSDVKGSPEFPRSNGGLGLQAEEPIRIFGNLAPGQESANVYQDRAREGGEHTYAFTATGSDGTKSTATAKVRVLMPKLEVTIAGPAERIVGRKSTYTVTVKNVGELILDDVKVETPIPVGVRLLGGSNAQKVAFAAPKPKLEPGQSFEHSFDVMPIQPGPITLSPLATGSRNTKAICDCRTTIDGIPAMRMEVVDLADPVEKGEETTYEIRLTNTGSKADANLKVSVQLPEELRFVSMSGPTKAKPQDAIDPKAKGTTIEFEPIGELAPKTEAVYRVKVKAIGTGDVRFKATLTSQHLTTPVSKEESTRIYGE